VVQRMRRERLTVAELIVAHIVLLANVATGFQHAPGVPGHRRDDHQTHSLVRLLSHAHSVLCHTGEC
jgi:hypothetical protein